MYLSDVWISIYVCDSYCYSVCQQSAAENKPRVSLSVRLFFSLSVCLSNSVIDRTTLFRLIMADALLLVLCMWYSSTGCVVQ